MDLRVQKTQKNIINAFLQVRAKKPLEKVTVKEIAELAEINKATFYLHYHDLYELSETLENEVIQSVLHGIEHPETIFKENSLFTTELYESIIANEQLINILFSGNRSINFITLFEKELKALIIKVKPEYQESLEKNVAITYLIYGGYYTYMKYHKIDASVVFKLIAKLSEEIVRLYE